MCSQIRLTQGEGQDNDAKDDHLVSLDSEKEAVARDILALLGQIQAHAEAKENLMREMDQAAARDLEVAGKQIPLLEELIASLNEEYAGVISEENNLRGEHEVWPWCPCVLLILD